MSGDKYAAGQHRGLDVAVGAATAIRAPTSGEVSFAGQVPTHGLTVTIATSDGYRASLTHLGELRVRKGDAVGEGDPIADTGPTGDAEHDTPYVHLGIRVGDGDTYVDPLGLLPPRSVPSPPPTLAAPPAPTPQLTPEPPAAAQPDPAQAVNPRRSPPRRRPPRPRRRPHRNRSRLPRVSPPTTLTRRTETPRQRGHRSRVRRRGPRR